MNNFGRSNPYMNQRPPMQQQPPPMGGYQRRIQAQGLQRPQAAPEQQRQKSDGGMGGMLGGMMGGMLSDKRSKEEISRLESTNEALTKALDGAFSGSNMPPTEYPSMPQNTRLPVGSASFADTPAANKVAAQNVGLRRPTAEETAMQAPMRDPSQLPLTPAMAQPAPRPSSFGGVQPAPPDLSALDEAYLRQSRGG